jgi:hypothetical protein
LCKWIFSLCSDGCGCQPSRRHREFGFAGLRRPKAAGDEQGLQRTVAEDGAAWRDVGCSEGCTAITMTDLFLRLLIVGLTLQAAILGSWPSSQDWCTDGRCHIPCQPQRSTWLRTDRHTCSEPLAVRQRDSVRVFAFWLARHGVRMEVIRVASLRRRARIEGVRAQRGLATCRFRGSSAGDGCGRTCASSRVECAWWLAVPVPLRACRVQSGESAECRAQSAERRVPRGHGLPGDKGGRTHSRGGPSGSAARDRVCVTGRDRVSEVD